MEASSSTTGGPSYEAIFIMVISLHGTFISRDIVFVWGARTQEGGVASRKLLACSREPELKSQQSPV